MNCKLLHKCGDLYLKLEKREKRKSKIGRSILTHRWQSKEQGVWEEYYVEIDVLPEGLKRESLSAWEFLCLKVRIFLYTFFMDCKIQRNVIFKGWLHFSFAYLFGKR